MNPITTRVFVVDDDESVRRGLGRLLKSAGHRAETFGSPQEFLRQTPHDGPGCLILDLQMPGMDGLQLQEGLAAAGWHLPIIFITGHGDIPSSVRAMKAGAVDFLPKPFRDEDLLRAIGSALGTARRDWEERAALTDLRSRLATLTPRELEVLRHVITGALNKQIAADLGTVEKTVKVHRAHVMEKLRVSSVAELVRLAQQAGIQPAGS